MSQCPKCANDVRLSELVTPAGPVMLAGTLAKDPQPIMAQVCVACGFIELYAPQPIAQMEVFDEEAQTLKQGGEISLVPT